MGDKKQSDVDKQEAERFGKILKELRLSRNLTQAAMAKLLNMSRETYGKYERGTRSMRHRDIMTIGEIFGKEFFERVYFPKNNISQYPVQKSQIRGEKKRWPIQILEVGRNMRALAMRFEQERYSKFTRYINAASQSVFGGTALAMCIRVLSVKFDLPFATPPGAIDWGFLLSCVTFIILSAFVKVPYLVEFAKWHRTTINR